MASHLERYIAGEHEDVWRDLVALGPDIRRQDTIEEALAVAEETMKRVAHNVDLLVLWLTEAGYSFTHPEWARQSPTEQTAAELDEVEERLGGPLPLSLRACLSIVGGVWLTGSHQDWPPTVTDLWPDSIQIVLADPLVLPTSSWLNWALNEWDHDLDPPGLRPFKWEFAPDEDSKADFGGSAHYIALPDPGMDPPIEGVRGRPNVGLVDYLRISFRWSGFPGFQFSEAPFPEELARLKEDLLPI
jgi:hypothetical protein